MTAPSAREPAEPCRYFAGKSEDGWRAVLRPHPQGDLIRYTDHAALLAAHAALEKERDALREKRAQLRDSFDRDGKALIKALRERDEAEAALLEGEG